MDNYANFNQLNLNEILNFLNNNGVNEITLRIVLLLLKRCQDWQEQSFEKNKLSEFLHFLQPAFGSPSQRLRRLSLKILQSFDQFLDYSLTEESNSGKQRPPTNKANTKSTLFQVLLEAEETPADFQGYRLRASIFRKLKFDHLQHFLPRNAPSELQLVVLDILLAQYYERLTIYWPLLIEIIESYANGLPVDSFWDAFIRALERSTLAIRGSSAEETTHRLLGNDEIIKISRIIKPSGNEVDQMPDYGSFRVQMFKLLTRFSSLAERRSKLLSPLFIDLYRVEFQRNNQPEEEEIHLDEASEKGDNLNAESSEGLSETKLMARLAKNFVFQRRKIVTNALKALLNVYAKFVNAKAIYRETEIRQIYNELLLSNDPDLQKGALACLCSYKQKFLLPYREHLENLLNEKKLKDELVLFTVDEQNCVLADEHRAPLMPIVLRLLYGCLHTHVATRGKTRRLAIFRFLTGCKSDELDLFIRLLFNPIIHFFEFDSDAKPDLIKAIESLEKGSNVLAISPQKIRSLLGNISNIFKYMSQTINDAQLQLLFATLIFTGLTVHLRTKLASESTEKERNSPTKLLKSLRFKVFLNLTKFFSAFSTRSISSDQVKCFFEHLLPPIITTHNLQQPKDVQDERQAAILPISVARLFCSWADKQRYHPLMNVPIFLGDDLEKNPETPISLLCNTLSNLGTPRSTQLEILRAVNSLLNVDSDEAEFIGNEFEDFGRALPQIALAKTAAEDLPFGCAILQPNLAKLLQYLSRIIATNTKQMARVPPICFDILSRISEFIEDAGLGESFALILLSYSATPKLLRNEERLVSVLNTMARLSVHVSVPLDYLRRLTILFSRLNGRQSREALLRVVASLSANHAISSDVAEQLGILAELESWDPKRIQEPDAERRSIAYQRMESIYERDEPIAIELLQIFAHSHAHCLLNATELSLRTSAANSVRHLIAHLGRVASHSAVADCQHFLHHHLIPLVLRGLRQKAETSRFEFVQCLIALIRTFPSDPQLGALHAINTTKDGATNDTTTSDFFENSIHIQDHRRQRAFYRLTERLNSDELDTGYNVLLKFILPIIEPYLMETTSKLASLSDQALQLLSAILARTPWTKYYQTLDNYLRQVDHEDKTKGAIRVIIAILDAFHFNLSECKMQMPKNWEKAKAKGRYKKAEVEESPPEEAEGMDVNEEDDEADEPPEEVFGKAVVIEETDQQRQKIFELVVRRLLPRLRECIQSKKIDFIKFQNQNHTHRKAKMSNFQNEEEQLLRAPLTLASVKLLKKLPSWVLDQNLSGLVLTLHRLLLSRLPSIRQSARRIMEQLIRILGPKHLTFVVSELKQAMNKGYQIHVMIFTVCSLVAALEADMRPGDLDSCLKDIIEVCKMESFGSGDISKTVDDQEENARGFNVPEAKANKTAETFTLIGRFISANSLDAVIGSMREILDARPRSGTIKRLSDWLRFLCIGLRQNAGIPPPVLLRYAHSLLTVHLPEMLNQQQQLNASKTSAMQRRSVCGTSQRPDNCLLLAPEPKRLGKIVKVALKSKVSVFIVFALQLMADVLKTHSAERKKPDDDLPEEEVGSDAQWFSELRPFVSLLIDALKLKFDKIISLSLRSLLLFLKYPLTELKDRIPEVVDRLFVILHDYAGLGSAGNKPAIIELQQLLFKCFTQVIREVPLAVLSGKNRVQLLLNYVETDILDSHKQATAFNLLKAIIGRRIEDPKVDDMIQYLAETAIVSSSAHIRTQCRQTLLLYLTSHPVGQKNIQKWVEFFLHQFAYELEDGRLSALEMVHAILDAFVEEVNDAYAFLIYLRLAERLTNVEDETERCRTYVALCIRKLFTSVTASAFNDLYAATRDWLDAKKESVRLLALNAFIQFAHSQSAEFSGAKPGEVLQRMFDVFLDDDLVEEQSEGAIAAALELFTAFGEKFATELCNYLLKDDERFGKFLENLRICLQMDSSPPIQLASATFLNTLLSNFDWRDGLVTKTIEAGDDALLSICQALITQLHSFRQDQAYNAISALTHLMPRLDAKGFQQMAKVLARLCWTEIAKQPDRADKRLTIFKLVAILALKCSEAEDQLNTLSTRFLPLLYREMSKKSAKFTEELHELATEVGQVFRDKMGDREFSALLASCQRDRAVKSEVRKRDVKARLVTNPAAAIAVKQRRHERKKEARKRKIDQQKPYRMAKRKRKAQMNGDADDD